MEMSDDNKRQPGQCTCTDITMDMLCSVVVISTDDHRMDGVFLTRIFIGLLTDIIDVLLVSRMFRFDIAIAFPLLVYLSILLVSTIFVFQNFYLFFYTFFMFVIFKLISTFHAIFLYILIRCEHKADTFRYVNFAYLYISMHVLFNIGELFGCIFSTDK